MSFYGGRPGKRGTKWFFNIGINEPLDETIYNEGDINLSSKGQIYIAGYNNGNLEFIDTGANITGSLGLQGDGISSIELITDPVDSNYMKLKVTWSKLQNGNFIEETEYIGPIGIDDVVLNNDTSLTISVGDKNYTTNPLGITDIVLNDDKTISFENANSKYTTEPLGITDIKNNDNTSLVISVGNKEYTTQPLGITNIEANNENNEYKLILKYANNGEFTTDNIKGEKGDTGKGLTIKYHVNTFEDLSTEAELGDVASVGENKEIYIYVKNNEINQWMNYGQLGSISILQGTETPETLNPDSFYLKTDTNELFIGLDDNTLFKVSDSDKMNKKDPTGTGSFTFNGNELISSDNIISESTHLTNKQYVDDKVNNIDISNQITGKMDKENPSGTGSFTLDDVELIPVNKIPTANTHLTTKKYVDDKVDSIDVSNQITGKMDKNSPFGTGSFTLNGNELISSDGSITKDTHLINKLYSNNNLMSKMNPIGTGTFSLNEKILVKENHLIEDDYNLTNKLYVDNLVSTKMDNNNPTGIGSFTFNGNELISSDGSIAENTHLTNKQYVDNKVISTKINITLNASNWTENSEYVIENENITENNDIELLPADNITLEQYLFLSGAMIIGTNLISNSITLKALSTIPTIDIPVILIIRG